MVVETSKPCQPSGLTALADLIQRKLPGYTRREAFEMIRKVRRENGGKLVGLKMKKFFRISRDIANRDVNKYKEKKRVKQLEIAKHRATCPFCFRILIDKYSRDCHVKNVRSKQASFRKSSRISM